MLCLVLACSTFAQVFQKLLFSSRLFNVCSGVSEALMLAMCGCHKPTTLTLAEYAHLRLIIQIGVGRFMLNTGCDYSIRVMSQGKGRT